MDYLKRVSIPAPFVYRWKRIQVLGNAESSYLKSLDEAEERARCFQLWRSASPLRVSIPQICQ